jgi:cytoskeletal protein CcmA (bactofilin family)
MSDPQGQVSDLTVEDSPLNQSFTSGEFADFLPDTSPYFEAWLENLKPALEPNKNLAQPAHLAANNAPAPGEFRFEGTLRVDCYVTGLLRSLTGTLVVSETAEVESDIIVATAIIDGFVRGDIHATERVELQSHAQVIGNIESPALAIQPGAIFEGQCHFLPSPFKSNAEDDGRTSSSNHAFSSPNLPSPNEEAAEPLAVAASR